MPISVKLDDCEQQVLLSIYFRSPVIRSLAMKAVAEEYGEDGFAADPRCTIPGKYEANINCSNLADAAVTYSLVRQAFEKVYGEALTYSDAVMGVREG